jgi:hypothetical protein
MAPVLYGYAKHFGDRKSEQHIAEAKMLDGFGGVRQLACMASQTPRATDKGKRAQGAQKLPALKAKRLTSGNVASEASAHA